MRKIPLSVICIFSLFCFSCNFYEGIHGDGNITTQTPSVGSFHNIDVSHAFDVYITQGSSNSVRIEADENLFEFIEVSTDGGTLEIGVRRGYNLRPSKKLKAYITSASYNSIRISGATNLYGETRIVTGDKLDIQASGASKIELDLDAPEVSIGLSGASKVDLQGQTKTLYIEASGASEINGYDLKSETADVNMSGASNANIYASVALEADLSGASHVRYKGNPRVDQTSSGASGVRKTD